MVNTRYDRRFRRLQITMPRHHVRAAMRVSATGTRRSAGLIHGPRPWVTSRSLQAFLGPLQAHAAQLQRLVLQHSSPRSRLVVGGIVAGTVTLTALCWSDIKAHLAGRYGIRIFQNKPEIVTRLHDWMIISFNYSFRYRRSDI